MNLRKKAAQSEPHPGLQIGYVIVAGLISTCLAAVLQDRFPEPPPENLFFGFFWMLFALGFALFGWRIRLRVMASVTGSGFFLVLAAVSWWFGLTGLGVVCFGGTVIGIALNRSAKSNLEQSASDVELGRIYEGKVAKIMDFGAFVTIAPGKDGLVHVSQISNERVEKVSDKLKEGDLVKVKVLEVDKQGRIRLSMKAVDEGEGESEVA
jgi:hypothetical protein